MERCRDQLLAPCNFGPLRGDPCEREVAVRPRRRRREGAMHGLCCIQKLNRSGDAARDAAAAWVPKRR
eukprot:736300-Alexandrium_andersonii.AAC.1